MLHVKLDGLFVGSEKWDGQPVGVHPPVDALDDPSKCSLWKVLGESAFWQHTCGDQHFGVALPDISEVVVSGFKVSLEAGGIGFKPFGDDGRQGLMPCVFGAKVQCFPLVHVKLDRPSPHEPSDEAHCDSREASR